MHYEVVCEGTLEACSYRLRTADLFSTLLSDPISWKAKELQTVEVQEDTSGHRVILSVSQDTVKILRFFLKGQELPWMEIYRFEDTTATIPEALQFVQALQTQEMESTLPPTQEIDSTLRALILRLTKDSRVLQFQFPTTPVSSGTLSASTTESGASDSYPVYCTFPLATEGEESLRLNGVDYFVIQQKLYKRDIFPVSLTTAIAPVCHVGPTASASVETIIAQVCSASPTTEQAGSHRRLHAQDHQSLSGAPSVLGQMIDLSLD